MYSSSHELKFSQKKLHRDVIVRLRQLNKNQRQIKPISRSTLDRMRQGKPITMETFLKLVNYLGEDVGKYIYYKKIN